MKLVSLAFRGVRGLPQRDIDLSAAVAAGRPFLVTGSAGSGKTTLLEAIAAAKEAASPYGLMPKRAHFRDPARPDGRVVLRWRREPHDALTLDAGDDTVTTSWSLAEGAPSDLVMAPGLRAFLGVFDRSKGRFKVEYAHAGRSFDPDDGVAELGRDGDRAMRVTRRARKYAWVRSYLEALGADDAEATMRKVDEEGILLGRDRARSLEGFAANVAALSPRLRWQGLGRRDGAWACLFAVKERGEVELRDLSDSERMVVLFAAAVDALGLASALLLVDQVELFIHPEDQVTFLNGLAAILPKGQVIATTTAPALLRSASPEHVLVLG